MDEIFKYYNNDFNRSSLEVQLALLQHAAESFSDLLSFRQNLDHAKHLLLSEVIKVGKPMLIIPATNAVSERPFSALKRVKTYLRATTTDTGMNNFMVLHIHKSYTDNFNLCEVADEFIMRRENRSTIFGTFL